MKIIKLLEGSELLYHVTDEVSMGSILLWWMCMVRVRFIVS